jgi:hypothetical protein
MLIKELLTMDNHIRWLELHEASSRLAGINMGIDSWNRLTYIEPIDEVKPFWVNYLAPRDARQLINFAYHVAGWLPKGKWKLFQVDNSTAFGVAESALLSYLLPNLVSTSSSEIQHNTYLVEFGASRLQDNHSELVLANVIYLFLLFEGHGFLVSASSNNQECLSIQDGVVYFSYTDKKISRANELIRDFEHAPLKLPRWLTEIEISNEDQG